MLHPFLPTIRIATKIVFLAATLCLSLCAQAAQWELNTTETRQVEAYLTRLNTDGLLVEHLESAAASETILESRRQLNGRLLGLYAKRMMSGQESKESKWREKSELILKTYPDLDSNTIRIAMLQSKYRENEASFQNWWNLGREPLKKTEQQENWRELATELTSLNQLLEQSYQNQIAAQQSLGADIDSKEIVHTEGILLHTNYLLGWSTYFTGVLNPNELRLNLRKSDVWFREFLQIESNKLLTEVPETWFDFSSPWQVRALVGLAMVQRGLNYPTECQYCFDLIENNSSDQNTRDLRYVWDFNSRIYLNDYTGASELIKSVDSSNQLSKNGRVSYWNNVVHSGIAIRNSAEAVARNFLVIGLTGLARAFEATLISDFLEQNRLQLSDVFVNSDNNFEALWVMGLLLFQESQAGNQPKLLVEAKSKLSNALAASTDATNPLDIKKCEFLIAKIDHLHRNYSDAAAAFLNVSIAFDQADRQLAAESHWLATRSLAELSRRDSRRLLDANLAIGSIIRRFPGSTFAKRAEFEKLRANLANVSPTEAIVRLGEISDQSLNYPVALNEIVKRRYEDWLQHFQSKSDQVSQKLISLFESELNYRRLPNATAESKVKSILLVIDALLRLDHFEQLQIRQRLDVAKRLVDRSGLTGNLFFEYRYYEFLFANRAGQTDQANRLTVWLSENAQGTRFEKSALVLLAQTADQSFRESTANQTATPQATEKLVSIFKRLVSQLGSSPQSLTSSPNARIAYARLAELKAASGNTEQAVEMFDVLNQLFPKNKSYLVGLGKAHSKSNNYESAQPIWRRLAGAVPAGSELWFESKYNLAVALFQTAKQKESRALIDQTVRLSPKMPETWKQQFDELTRQIDRIR